MCFMKVPRYHMGKYKLDFHSSPEGGKALAKAKIFADWPLKSQTWAYSHTVLINDSVQNEESVQKASLKFVEAPSIERKKDQTIIEEELDDLKNWSEKAKMKFSSVKYKARDWVNTENFCCELAAPGNDGGEESRGISSSHEYWKSQMWHGHEKAKCSFRKYQVILAETSYCYYMKPSKISSELLVNCG